MQKLIKTREEIISDLTHMSHGHIGDSVVLKTLNDMTMQLVSGKTMRDIKFPNEEKFTSVTKHTNFHNKKCPESSDEIKINLEVVDDKLGNSIESNYC